MWWILLVASLVAIVWALVQGAFWVALGIALVTWILLEAKTSRPDGELVAKVPPYRRLMPYIMRGRNESVVYFDKPVRAEKLEAYLELAKDAFGANLTHVLVAACGIGLGENPRMNQFVSGYRLYKRKGRFVTFSMKRKKMSKRAKLSVVKLEMRDGETFRELTERINANIEVERSGKRTATDVEYDLFNLLPRPLLSGAARLIRALDYYGLLPYDAFIKGDGMYTSMFVANLGSLGMAPGYHHLYEWGNCPLFLMVGKIEDRVIVENGQIVHARVLPLRFSYDERIDDGLTANYGIESVARVIEDPFRWLGCLAADGSDKRPMWPHQDEVDLGDDSEVAV